MGPVVSGNKTTTVISNNYTPILTNPSFEVQNGFLGMKRDVILRLFNFLWDDSCKVKMTVGMCEEHCVWIKHSYFLENKPLKIPVSFRINEKGLLKYTHTPLGETCLFENGSEFRTVFLDYVVAKGFIRWTVKISYGESKSSYFWIGAAPPDLLDKCAGNALGMKAHGTWSFSFFKTKKIQRSNLFGMRTSSYIPHLATSVPDGSMVAVEADAAACTLSFFVDGVKVPHGFSHTPFPLYLGISTCTVGTGRPSFTSLSLHRLRAPTPSLVQCRLYQCKLN